MKQVLSLVALVAAASGVALVAATSRSAFEYFVVRDPDKKCRIVESIPADRLVVIIGRAYPSKKDAEKQMQAVCKERS